MELLGTHKVTFDLLRSIAIECHALDVAAYHLFVDSTHLDGVEKTKEIYEELMTSLLLNLAISLRTKFYQGLDHRTTIPFVSHCGFLFKYANNQEETVNFSIKDVCDKIVHADSVSRYMEPEIQHPTTSFRGKDLRSNSTWELSMSVNLFTEAVLNWIHHIETNQPSISCSEIAQ